MRERFTYYLGARPNWLNGDHVAPRVPLFVSATTLARYRTRDEAFPVGRWFNWALDSGAYTALTGGNEAHPWHDHPDLYGGLVTRLMEDCGEPDFAAPQDWPCEPAALEASGLTVRDHIELTVENFLYLRREFSFVPWIPVIQGWEPADYLYCEQLYLGAGVDLAAQRRVGIGSICRRGSVPGIVEVIRMFAQRGYRLHGFGVKIDALPLIGHLLTSADSYAWSDTARKDNELLDGCDHRTRVCERDHGPACREHLTDCRNCPRYAQQWRERVLATLPARPLPRPPAAPARAEQLALFDVAALGMAA